jgi:hypothetical protein
MLAAQGRAVPRARWGTTTYDGPDAAWAWPGILACTLSATANIFLGVRRQNLVSTRKASTCDECRRSASAPSSGARGAGEPVANTRMAANGKLTRIAAANRCRRGARTGHRRAPAPGRRTIAPCSSRLPSRTRRMTAQAEPPPARRPPPRRRSLSVVLGPFGSQIVLVLRKQGVKRRRPSSFRPPR